jgi:hypothetical protein
MAAVKSLVGLFVTIQSQANLMKVCVECLHSKAYALSSLFGGNAISRKHVVFSRLALNSYINFICIKAGPSG